MGACSTSLAPEPAKATKKERPKPERKYIHGLPLPVRGSDFSFFQPRVRQKGISRSNDSVTYRKRISSAKMVRVVPASSFVSESRTRSSCFGETCRYTE